MKASKTSSSERRKTQRGFHEQNNDSVIEIRHTYGPEKRTVYQLCEYNENGLSFLVPREHGYFMAGTPLEFSIPGTKHLGQCRYGKVCYYIPFYTSNGEAYYRIGLQIMPEYRDLEGKDYTLRPPRYRGETLSTKPVVEIKRGNRKEACEIIDLSRYSVAFYVNEPVYSLRLGSVIPELIVWHSDKEIYRGEGTIIKIIPDDEGDKTRIVVQPRGEVLDIESMEKLDKWDSVRRIAGQTMSRINGYESLAPEFKNAVYSFRFFMEEFKSFLETNDTLREVDKCEIGETQLDKLEKIYFPEMEKRMKQFDQTMVGLKLSDNEYPNYQKFAQNQLHYLTMESCFCHRIFCKPLGYPGDYVMMRMIRNNDYEGNSIFGKILNKYYTECALSKANRNRNRYLCDKLAQLVYNKGKDRVSLLSVASGPAFEITDLIQKNPTLANKMDITFLDQEIDALKYAQHMTYESKIKHECTIKTTFKHSTVGNFVKENRKTDTYTKFDIIYAFGLFDYLDDNTAQKLITHLSHFLNPDGTIILSNYSSENQFHGYYLSMVLEWYMIYRNKEQLAGLIPSKNVKRWYIDEEESGIIKFPIMDYV